MAKLIDFSSSLTGADQTASPYSSSYPQFAQNYSTGEGSSEGSSLFSSVASKVPWLGVLNLFASGIGAYMNYQAAKEQAAQREKEYQENVRRWNTEMEFNKSQAQEKIREWNTTRKDNLKQLWSSKMEYMLTERPVLREKARQAATYRYKAAA